jgi:hypothetical protein
MPNDQPTAEQREAELRTAGWVIIGHGTWSCSATVVGGPYIEPHLVVLRAERGEK